MSPALAAYIYIVFSIGLGSAICYLCFGSKVVFKVALGWTIITTVSMFGNIILLVATAIFIFLSVKDESHEVKILYFVALLPVLPLDPYLIPFPGLNFLWDLKFTRLLVLLFLFPLFMIFVNKMIREGPFLRLSDLFFLAFFLMNVFVLVRLGNPTNIVRAAFSVLVDYGIPYFAISRFLLSPMSLNWLFCLFLIGATYVSFVSIIESALSWRMYAEILNSLGMSYDPFAMMSYERGGVVRASGGPFWNPLAFAYYLSLAFVVTFFMWRQKLLQLIPAVLLMGLFMLSLFLTGSRGGLLSLMVGIFMLYYMKVSPNLKVLLLVVGGGLFIILAAYFNSYGFSAIDSEGTFEYRLQLIENSMGAIQRNFLFGSGDYLNDPGLEQSRQGQGIIDIVNMYLRVALEMGVVGLFFFVGSFVVVIRDVWKKPSVCGTNHRDLLIALLIMGLVFIATCSAVTYIPWYLFLFLAVARAYTNFVERPTGKTIVNSNQLLQAGS